MCCCLAGAVSVQCAVCRVRLAQAQCTVQQAASSEPRRRMQNSDCMLADSSMPNEPRWLNRQSVKRAAGQQSNWQAARAHRMQLPAATLCRHDKRPTCLPPIFMSLRRIGAPFGHTLPTFPPLFLRFSTTFGQTAASSKMFSCLNICCGNKAALLFGASLQAARLARRKWAAALSLQRSTHADTLSLSSFRSPPVWSGRAGQAEDLAALSSRQLLIILATRGPLLAGHWGALSTQMDARTNTQTHRRTNTQTHRRTASSLAPGETEDAARAPGGWRPLATNWRP